jgi:hypothetical protein
MCNCAWCCFQLADLFLRLSLKIFYRDLSVYICTESDVRTGPPAGDKPRGNLTHTAQSKTTQRKAKRKPKTHTRGAKQTETTAAEGWARPRTLTIMASREVVSMMMQQLPLCWVKMILSPWKKSLSPGHMSSTMLKSLSLRRCPSTYEHCCCYCTVGPGKLPTSNATTRTDRHSRSMPCSLRPIN